MMSFFRRSSTNKAPSSLRLEIFVDSIKSRNKDPLIYVVKKDMLIKDLRMKIAKEKDIEVDNLVLLINFRFWDDDIKINEIIKEMSMVNNAYIVHAVVITAEDEETIDYNIESFLKEKYTSNSLLEPEYVIIGNSNDQVTPEEILNVPSNCLSCHSSKRRQSIVVLEYCKHKFCRKCLSPVLNESFGKSSKCPQENCDHTLIDYDYQKILSAEEYRKWETLVGRKSPGDDNFFIPKIGWVCQSCTFLNKPYLKFCDVCAENRPDDYRVPKFYVPTNEEWLIKRQDDEEKKRAEEESRQIEVDKEQRLNDLRNLAKQSVTFSHERTECPICLMDYEAGQAIVLHSCLHNICKECLHNYLVNIDDAQVKCPTENCIGLIEDREIRKILSGPDLERYDELNLRMAEAKEKFSYHCKEVNCTAWIVKDGNLTSFTCPKCKNKNCITCEAIHKGETCEDYQSQKSLAPEDLSQMKNDRYIQGLIDAGEAMRCPGCRMIVEKNRGCDGVTCRGCSMMICWATKGPRWGPKGKGDRSGGCGCRFLWGRRCHPSCHYCH